MAIRVTDPAGVRIEDVSSTPTAALGAMAWGQDNSKWVYCLAQSTITQYMCVGLDKSYTANPITKAHADAGRKPGIAQTAFAVGQYGWVAVQGGNDLIKVRAKNACLPAVALYTTGTAGYLDDTAASQTLVNGIVLTDTATASGASKTAFLMCELFSTPAP
jgi:hypothetical protein